jgi:hypothetical protein
MAAAGIPGMKTITLGPNSGLFSFFAANAEVDESGIAINRQMPSAFFRTNFSPWGVRSVW